MNEIPVVGPTYQGQSVGKVPHTVPPHVQNKHNYLTSETTFSFRTDKELGIKRPSITLNIPKPTADLVLDVLDKGGPALDLLLEVMGDVIIAAARDQVNENTAVSQDTLDLGKMDWHYLASMPKVERRGGGIAKEIWEAFQADYINIMPQVTGKTLDRVSYAAQLLSGKFAQCKTNKLVLSNLREWLALWYNNTKNQDEFAECYRFLDAKAVTLLNADEAVLLDNL